MERYQLLILSTWKSLSQPISTSSTLHSLLWSFFLTFHNSKKATKRKGWTSASAFRQRELQRLQSRTPHLPDATFSGRPESSCVYTIVSTSVYISATQKLRRVLLRVEMKARMCCKTDRRREREQNPLNLNSYQFYRDTHALWSRLQWEMCNFETLTPSIYTNDI